jgi:nucleoside-diphosphate-sugar epimerase
MIVLLTGATGFLGNCIHRELTQVNKVITISRNNSDINIDLANEIPQLPYSDLVIHCAGKAHSVPKTKKEKQMFYDINVKGTTNLLDGLENCERLPNSFIFISTVAVYGCSKGLQLDENQPLNAEDAYGQSKIIAEQLVQKWCAQNNIICSILRLPLLIGENPPGNLAAMIKGIKKGYYFNIDKGKAKKSMVLLDDVAKILQKVATIGGVYNLTDGHHPSFAELSNLIKLKLGKQKIKNIPMWLAILIARIGDMFGNVAPLNSSKVLKLSSDLTFDDSRARKLLNWNPKPVLKEFLSELPLRNLN